MSEYIRGYEDGRLGRYPWGDDWASDDYLAGWDEGRLLWLM